MIPVEVYNELTVSFGFVVFLANAIAWIFTALCFVVGNDYKHDAELFRRWNNELFGENDERVEFTRKDTR